MSVEKHKLSNGATVLIDHMPNAKTTALSYMFQIGSRFETEEENGLAHFFEHMAFKGTTSRDVHTLLSEQDDLGARSNAFTSKEVTLYYMHGLAEDVFKFNDIQADMAINLTLPEEELRKERGVILEEIKRAQDNPQQVMFSGLFEQAYPDQAYGRTTLGPSINIKNFDREIFDSFRKKHYLHAGNLVVSVAGCVDPERILKDVEEKTSSMPAGERSTYSPAEYKGGQFTFIKPTSQVNLAVAFEASAAGHEDNMAESIMNSVLSGGMSSRLSREIREKRSLVYSVSAGINRSFDTGFFYAVAGTSPEKVSELLPVLCAELDKIRQTPVSDEEFERAKKKFQISVAMEQDSMPDDRMTNMAMEHNMKGFIETDEDFNQRLQSVTKDDLMRVAQKIFSGKPTFASVGPPKPTEQEEIAMRLGLEL